MATHPGASWSQQRPHAPDGHPAPPPHPTHSHSPSTSSSSSSGATYPTDHSYPYHPSYYPHGPPPPQPGHHSTSPPPHQSQYQQQPYYPYPSFGSAPFPPPFPPAHPYPHPPHALDHGHHPEHPGYSSHANSIGPSSSRSSETTATTSEPAKTPATSKIASATKIKAKKEVSSQSSKTPSVPKTPKTFRFEGSISSESFKTTKSFDLAGVNILNRKPLDTKTALDKLQRRRETHNRVERKRRDCINQLIDDLTRLLPPRHLEEVTSKCHRVNVLRGAVSHIKFLNDSNEALTKSIRELKGDEAPLPIIVDSISIQGNTKSNSDMIMEVDNDGESVKLEDLDDESLADSQGIDSLSRSGSPVSFSQATPSIATSVSSPASTSRRMALPPVIITDAPSPSTERDPGTKVAESTDPFSLESRPRSNSFASSVNDQASPRSVYSASPMFPPSPISPLPVGRQGVFPPGEENVDNGVDQRHQLSPFLGHTAVASASPSLPPISSLASMQLQSPPGNYSAVNSERSQATGNSDSTTGSSFSGRSHRAGTALPPLMIPEQPHHLHPSYQQGGGKSGSSSNRTSMTLSPHSADQPPISPFMLSPMLSRSPSIGPVTASSPGNSPYPHWGQDGASSPHGFTFTSPHIHPYGYQHSHVPSNHQNPPQQPLATSPPAHPQSSSTPSQTKTRPHSLQPEPIFIQEEPWNTQRKRSTSGISTKGSSKEKKKVEESAIESTNRASSPTLSAISSMSYPASPNPKKRAQPTSHDHAPVEDEEGAKRSKQTEFVVAIGKNAQNPEQRGGNQNDEDAAQALTTLAHASS